LVFVRLQSDQVCRSWQILSPPLCASQMRQICECSPRQQCSAVSSCKCQCNSRHHALHKLPDLGDFAYLTSKTLVQVHPKDLCSGVCV
jgi:predicted O-linked N-acetylglucosamine transferase (SPINDLY family)